MSWNPTISSDGFLRGDTKSKPARRAVARSTRPPCSPTCLRRRLKSWCRECRRRKSCQANVPLVSTPVVIDWDQVTRSHPEIGKFGPVQIGRYQLFVEREGVKLSLDLPPTVTEFRVPSAVIALGQQFKFEVIARTTTGNNTAVESCFQVQ